MGKEIILGVDPGLTTAFAVLDLEGNILAVESAKTVGINWVIERAIEFGKPFLVAGDRERAGEALRKIAASFNCELFLPERDIEVEKKIEIAKGEELKNQHERDALAAALIAYRAHARGFAKIKDSVGEKAGEVRELLIGGKAKNIAEALERIEKPMEEKEIEREIEKPRIKSAEEKLRKELENRVKLQKQYIEKIEGKIKGLEKNLEREQEEQRKRNETARRAVLKEREIAVREGMIKQLQWELQKERGLRRDSEKREVAAKEAAGIVLEGRIPVYPVFDLSRESIERAEREFGTLKGKAVAIIKERGTGAVKFLVEKEPAAVFCSQEIGERLKETGLTVLTTELEKGEVLQWIGREELEKLAKEGEKTGFLDWLKRYKSLKGE
ncbi:MAG: DUF460 domain-containing protein [Candidatus Aenigmarchaeota archaeon]|nr:DUF460 domain-containing protein [Candidatus Aenigmarchaeota archaeon]